MRPSAPNGNGWQSLETWPNGSAMKVTVPATPPPDMLSNALSRSHGMNVTDCSVGSSYQ